MKVLFRAKTVRQDYQAETNGLKKISDVWYAIGKEQPCVAEYHDDIKICALWGEDSNPYLCHYNTRAINFQDTLDKENNPIFASLDHENGIGGDILKTRGYSATCFYENGFNIETITGLCYLPMVMDKTLVIGIQK